MNGKLDKKKILKQMEENRKNARRLVKESVRDAKKILKDEGLMGYESSPLAVVGVAEALFRIEASVIQGKAKVDQAEMMQKAAEEAQARKQKACEGCQQKRSSKTPVA